METQAQLEDQAFLAIHPKILAKLPTSVDVFIMTRNSGRFLDGCLRSVEHGVNVNRLIVIDGGSTDETLEIARRHGAEILSDKGLGLGYARKLAATLCETKWLCFIDADVELPEGWHEGMMRYAVPGVGAVASLVMTAPVNDYERRIIQIQNRRARYRGGDLEGQFARGFTGATLIRTRLLLGLRMPNIRSMEDYVITQHILRRSRWLRVPIFVNHHDRFSERLDRISHNWAAARFLRRIGTIKFLLKRTKTVVKNLIISIAYGEPLNFVHHVRYSVHALRGWFFWHEYIDKSYPTGRVKAPPPGLSLNVGCGATRRHPFRDFGCDLNADISVPEMEIPNYIRCDALHLPFRPVFDRIVASHLVEHLFNPRTAIEEFKSIAQRVTVTVPHWLSTDAYLDPTHRWVRFASGWRPTPSLLHLLIKLKQLRRIANFAHRLLGMPRQTLIELETRR